MRARHHTPLWAKRSPPVAGMLALVDPHLPCTRGGLRALEHANPKLHALFSRLLEVAEILKPLEGQERRSTFITRVVRTIAGVADLKESDITGDSYAQFEECLKIVRRAERGITRAYVPDKYVNILFPETPTTTDPLELFLLGFKEQPDGWRPNEAERRAIFEAQRDLALTMFYFGLAATKRIVGKRRDKKERAKGAKEYREPIFQFLLEQGLLARMPGYRYLHSLHNPQNAMRAVWLEHIHGQEPSRAELEKRRTKLHFAELILPNRRIPILVEVRRKGFMQIVGKMFAVEGKGVQEVEDRRGLRFGYATLADLQEGAEHLQRAFPLTDFVTGDERLRDNTADPAQPLNTFSAPNFRMVSFFRMIAGQRGQVQNCLATQVLDLIHSRGAENHALYHLRQYTDAPSDGPTDLRSGGLFFRLFPPEIYGIHWNAPDVPEELVHHVLASLPR